MFSFTSSTIPSNIFVIGAGGTGSRLMPMLAQFMRSITRGRSATGWVENPTIWLVDDDVVEMKNLLRQNFIASDVGKAKAEVVAERYQRAYEVNITPIIQRITSDNIGQFWNVVKETILSTAEREHPIRNDNNFMNNLAASSIVIICVDSVEARRDIFNTFISNPYYSGRGTLNNTIFIDAGNEDSFGQVSYFTPHRIYGKEEYETSSSYYKVPKMVPVVIPINHMPMDVDYYINLRDTESTASCADLNQTLAINALMATGIMNLVQNIYYRKPMNFNCLRISLDGGNSTEYNTFNNFARKSYDGSSSPSSTEKNGTRKALTFVRLLNTNNIRDFYASNIIVKIREEETAAQKVIRDAEIAKEAAIQAEKAKIKAEELRKERVRLAEIATAEIKVRSQLELKARLQAKHDLAKKKKEELKVEALSLITEMAVGSMVAELSTEATTAPELIAIPKTPAPKKAKPRKVVELEAVPVSDVPAQVTPNYSSLSTY